MPERPFVVLRGPACGDPELRARAGRLLGAEPVAFAPDMLIAARSLARVEAHAVAWSGLLVNAPELGAAADDAGAAIGRLLAAAPPGDAGWLSAPWGEFAYAARDARDGGVWLVRDRVGVHPLFVARAPGVPGISWAAATSIRLLLAATGMPPRPRLDQAARFLGTHYRHYEHDGRATAFEGIERVPPGTALRSANDTIREIRYWSAPFSAADAATTEAQAAEAVASLLEDAVRRRVADLADGGAAFSLSSGMDSSSVLALASRRLGTSCPVYTSTFPGWIENEEHDAAEAAAPFGRWQGLPIQPIPDFLAAAERLHAVHDEPVCTVTWYWDHLVQGEAASRGCQAFFGGLGGDELFAGEYEHFFFRFADIDASGDATSLEREVASWKRLHDHPRYPKDEALVRETWRRMRGANGATLPDPVRHGRYLAVLAPELRAAAGPPLPTENPFPDYLRNRLWQDLSRETTLPCARAAWANAVAAGQEIRYPFLDHRVVELAFSLPGEWKVRDGVQKVVLRRAMRGILPDAVTQRTQKTGWTSPAYLWFRGDALARIARADGWATLSLYDRTERDRLIAEHRDGAADHSMLFWQIVALEAWWRRWFG